MKGFLFSIFILSVFIFSCSSGAKTAKNDADNGQTGDSDNISLGDSDSAAQNDSANNDANNDSGGNDTIIVKDGDNTTVSDEDIVSLTCGNNTIEGGEVCDGGVKNCVEIDPKAFTGGKALCKSNCTGWDTVTCDEVAHTCGNYVIEGPEVCDRETKNCIDIDGTKFSSGKAKCNDDCTGWDTSTCDEIAHTCGNNIIEGPEVCDGAINCGVRSHTPAYYNTDISACNASCSAYDDSACKWCGDGIISNGEACDNNTKNCVDIDTAKYLGGKALCNNTCNGWYTATCEGKAVTYDCDKNLTSSTQDPADYAIAIGLCQNVVSAALTQTTVSGTPNVNAHGILSSFGTALDTRDGSYMLALTSGKVAVPVGDGSFKQSVTSAAPSDWYTANGSKFPSSPACGTAAKTYTGSALDNVMLTLELKVPDGMHSFSVDLDFYTFEYPSYICSQYNDSLVILLDSEYTSSDNLKKNPADKNICKDGDGNSCGPNIAPAGFFRQCANTSGTGWAVTSCTATAELAGTGFETHGATGWFTARGNVVPGETITLRFAIWDVGDDILDSLVLIDKFRWNTENITPGISLN